MSTYIKLSTLEFPRHEGDIRLEHPEISEELTGPFFPCPSTYAPVAYVEPPKVNIRTEVYEMLPPVQDESGNWKMAWSVRSKTAEEIETMDRFNQEVMRQKISGIQSPPADI